VFPSEISTNTNHKVRKCVFYVANKWALKQNLYVALVVGVGFSYVRDILSRSQSFSTFPMESWKVGSFVSCFCNNLVVPGSNVNVLMYLLMSTMNWWW